MRIKNRLSPLALGIALSMTGYGVSAQEDPYPKLPGEPQVQPAQPGKLSEAEAIKLAVNWAKFGKDPSAEAFIDTAITAISIGYPPAGLALGAAKGLIMGLAGGPDPVAEALKVMDKRIAALEKNVADLAKALSSMHNQMLLLENRIRMGELQRRRDEISELKGALAVMRERPATAREKYELTQRVQRLAARFRPDSSADNDMWQWADLHVYTNKATGKLESKPFEADFRTLPLMEAYLNSLLLLMAAIQHEGRDQAYVKATYKDELMRHVQALSVRPYWLEGDDQYTLPERLMARVSCVVQAVQKYPERDGTCSAAYATCTDNLARRTTVVSSAIPDWHSQDRHAMCTATTNRATPRMRAADREDLERKWEVRSDAAPWGSEALLRVRQYTGYSVPAEEVLENFHGLETMTALADRLHKLAMRGTLMEAPVYSFDHTYWDKEYLYGVKNNGELIWFGHLIGEDRNPPKDDARFKARIGPSISTSVSGTATRGLRDTAVTARANSSTSISGAATVASGRAATTAAQARITGQETIVPRPPEYPIVHNWEGPRTVGSGWQNMRDIVPAAMTSVSTNAAGASFYAVAPDGALVWYRHDGFVNGEPRWKGPIKVGSGWHGFTKVVSAGDGVLYGVGTDGSLRWYRQNDVAEPTPAAPKWTGPQVVGSSWGHFVHIFSTGEGVIYAVDPQGKLWWYKHRGYLTGTQDWAGPKQVGTGWAGFKKVFSPSEGYIYALTQAGELLWYQHQGYQDGTVRWRGPTPLGAAWGDYKFVFSAMQGTPQAPVVR